MTTDTSPLQPISSEISEPAPAIGRRRPGTWTAVLAAVLVIPMLVAGALTALAPTTNDPLSARLISAQALEADYGIRFDMVNITASGGLVDLRFTVVDEAKAKRLFHDAASSPALLVDGTRTVIRMRKAMAHHGISLLSGAKYFVLYPNAGGAVQSGTKVSVVIDDIRLEPIAAQS